MKAVKLDEKPGELALPETPLKTWDAFYDCFAKLSTSLGNTKLTINPNMQDSQHLKNALLFNLIENFPFMIKGHDEMSHDAWLQYKDKLNQDQLKTISLICFLLENGVTHSTLNGEGNTPLHQLLCAESDSRSENFRKLIQLFLLRGASLQTPNSKGENPIIAITTAQINRNHKIRNLYLLSRAIRNSYIDMKLQHMNAPVRNTMNALIKAVESKLDTIFCAGEFEQAQRRVLSDGSHLLTYICQLIDELSVAKKPEDFIDALAKCKQKCEPHFESYFPIMDFFKALQIAVGMFVMVIIIGVVTSLIITGSPHFMIIALGSTAIGAITGYISADFSNNYKQPVDTEMNKLEELFQESTTSTPRI